MDKVRVWFATNRNHQPRNKGEPFGGAFNPDGVAALRFGRADFDVDPVAPTLRTLTVIPDPKPGEDDPDSGSVAFLDQLRAVMSAGDRSDTLLFIHGFNVSFLGALQAGALLAQGLRVEGRPVNLVVFSWPSDGRKVPWMSYYSDREDARASGPALARAFLKFRDYVLQLQAADYCRRNVHLLTHSMGAYVLRQGLQALLAKEPKAMARLFEQILLAAPDENDDAFESDAKLKLLPQLARQVTVYFNPDDKGLLVSDVTKANPDRLGSDGPRLVDLLPKKVALVDCREVAGDADRWVEHSYYIRSEAMTRDMDAVLAGEPPDRIGNRIYVERQRAWRIDKELAVRPAQPPR